MKNLDVRKALHDAHIFHYQLAEALNISEMTFLKRLRKEFSKEEKEKIFSLIEKIRKQNY